VEFSVVVVAVVVEIIEPAPEQKRVEMVAAV
jgi:hypothetical protein